MTNFINRGSEFYNNAFANTSRVLRIFHRDLKYGFLTIHMTRTEFIVRWTVKRKGYKKFVYSTPITFESLATLSPSEVYKMSEDITQAALSQLPKELINKPND